MEHNILSILSCTKRFSLNAHSSQSIVGALRMPTPRIQKRELCCQESLKTPPNTSARPGKVRDFKPIVSSPVPDPKPGGRLPGPPGVAAMVTGRPQSAQALSSGPPASDPSQVA